MVHSKWKKILYATILGSYKFESTSHDAVCAGIIQEYSNYDNNEIKNICKNAIYYMNELKENNDNINLTNGCIYLYYSLYDMTHKKLENSEQIKKLYQYILGIYDQIQHTNLRDTEININENIYGKLKNLDNLYKHLYNYSKNISCNQKNPCNCAETCINIYAEYVQECNKDYYTPFCKELQKFGEKFNDTIKKNNRCNGTVNLLPIFSKYNFEIIIIIPIVALLGACSFLFILLKFSPLGSFLSPQKTKKKNMVNKLKQSHNNILQASEYEKSNYKNRPYNISYKSSEYS